MSRSLRSTLFAVLAAAAVTACAEEKLAPQPGDKLTGFSVGEIKDTAVTGGSPSTTNGPGPIQVGGIVKGVGVGSDTMATAPKLEGVVVKAYKHLGYSGNDVRVGDEIGTLTTDANGWFGWFSLPPGNYVVSFTPPASGPFRGTYVTYESQGAPAGTTVAWTWGIFLPRK